MLDPENELAEESWKIWSDTIIIRGEFDMPKQTLQVHGHKNSGDTMQSSNARIMLLFITVLCSLTAGCVVDTNDQEETTALVEAIKDPISGQLILTEAGQTILQYNYWTI